MCLLLLFTDLVVSVGPWQMLGCQLGLLWQTDLQRQWPVLAGLPRGSPGDVCPKVPDGSCAKGHSRRGTCLAATATTCFPTTTCGTAGL